MLISFALLLFYCFICLCINASKDAKDIYNFEYVYKPRKIRFKKSPIYKFKSDDFLNARAVDIEKYEIRKVRYHGFFYYFINTFSPFHIKLSILKYKKTYSVYGIFKTNADNTIRTYDDYVQIIEESISINNLHKQQLDKGLTELNKLNNEFNKNFK